VELRRDRLATSWDISPGGTSEVIVAVVDTGVTAVTPQTMAVKTWNGSAIVNFSPQVGPSPDITFGRLVSARDFTISSTNPSTFVVDTDGHGTHVASTIGEDTNNSVAEAGIAYNARIMPVKVCMSYWDVQFAMSAAGLPGFADLDAGGCPTSAIAAGIRYAADNGAKVMNISLGGTSRSQLELDALTYAVSRGVFVSISNGNEFEDGNPVSYPASFCRDDQRRDVRRRDEPVAGSRVLFDDGADDGNRGAGRGFTRRRSGRADLSIDALADRFERAADPFRDSIATPKSACRARRWPLRT
jgi:serine protease